MEIGKEEAEERKDRPSAARWLSKIEASQEAQKEHNDLANEAWREYLGVDTNGTVKDNKNQTRYPIYWSSVQTIQPALYSRTPIPVIEKAFNDLRDDLGRLGAIMNERLANYLMSSTPFDRVMYHTRDLFIHAGRTTCRVFFDGAVSEEVVRKKYTKQERDGVLGLVNEEGEAPEEGEELFEEDGEIYSESVSESIAKAQVELLPVFHDDYLHNANARTSEEVDWMAFRSLLTKEEAEDRFGEEIANRLKYTDTRSEEKNEKQKAYCEKNVAVWEIWDKTKKQVLWVADCYKDDVLDVKPDPYELQGFFPCAPLMLGTVGHENLYTVPDYAQLRSLILQLHALGSRFRKLVAATKKRGLADGSVDELRGLTSGDDGDFLFVNNFKELIGDGGIEKLVKFFPTGEIVEAIQTLANVSNMFEQKFNEIWGIPDILRGTSDPRETAAAQQLKGSYATLRFSSRQREFQRLVRDSIELMCDLALKKLPQEKLMQIMGYEFMSPEDQALFPQALTLISDDSSRKLRINIETDSTITQNQASEAENRNYLAKSLFEGLKGIGQLSQQAPEYMPVLAQTILYVIRGLRDGKQLEDELETILQAQLQKQQQPQQPPPPDPQIVKAQMEAQLKQQQMQMEAQSMQAKMALQQAELQIKAQSLQVQLQKILADSQNEQQKTALEAQIADIDAFLKTSKLELEKEYLGLDLAERIQTEKRLQIETDLKVKEANKPEVRDGSGF